MSKSANELFVGYRHFVGQGGAQAERLKATASGQAPEHMLITCADSRIDPALIFAAAPGDIFTIRNVGALVPSPADIAAGTAGAELAAALEFALSSFPIRQIMVLGHSGCGASRALAGLSRRRSNDALGTWLSVAKAAPDLAVDASPAALEQAMIKLSIANLQTWPIVQQSMVGQKLEINGAWFSIADLTLHILDQSGAFNPLSAGKA